MRPARRTDARKERQTSTWRAGRAGPELQDVERRRFAHVADVALVRDAEQMHARSVDRLAHRVQRVRDPLHDVLGHRAVHLPRQLDEPAFEAALPRLPRQIERIDRDAVAAQARAPDKTA